MTESIESAEKWLLKAAEMVNAEARCELGFLYHLGFKVLAIASQSKVTQGIFPATQRLFSRCVGWMVTLRFEGLFAASFQECGHRLT